MDLKGVRKALGLSQIELDRRANLPRGTVNDIERGRNSDPSLTVCVALADALRRAGAKGVEVEQLFSVGTEREAS